MPHVISNGRSCEPRRRRCVCCGHVHTDRERCQRRHACRRRRSGRRSSRRWSSRRCRRSSGRRLSRGRLSRRCLSGRLCAPWRGRCRNRRCRVRYLLQLGAMWILPVSALLLSRVVVHPSMAGPAAGQRGLRCRARAAGASGAPAASSHNMSMSPHHASNSPQPRSSIASTTRSRWLHQITGGRSIEACHTGIASCHSTEWR
jgi:hypothetical protein